MDKKIKCWVCNRSDGNLMVQSRKANKYICRDCNKEKAKNYRNSEEGKKKIYTAVYKSIQKHWHKQVARMELNKAVRKGDIVKPTHCKCGNNRVEGHHKDYSKPLEVDWLCRSCHADIHRLEDKLV